MYYLYKDHLGSITTITNQSGAVVERHSFDAWGRLRNPQNWNFNNVSAMTLLDRGYTGHEHLTDFGLINMNGRMYDPLIGQMLSPDPYVQAPDNTQSFNRYSYCYSNPLKYTDPSGEYAIVDDIIAAAVGGVVNLVVNACQGNLGGHGVWGGIGCLDSFVFSNNEIFHGGDSVTYQAGNQITTGNASFVMQTRSKVTLIAGNTITLNPGFEAQSGSNFIATIAPCVSPTKHSVSGEEEINTDIPIMIPEYKQAISHDDMNRYNVVTCFPNPATDKITFYFQIPNKSEISISIFDLLGNKMAEFSSIKEHSIHEWYTIDINISDYPEGVYIYNINFKRGQENGKFIKVR